MRRSPKNPSESDRPSKKKKPATAVSPYEAIYAVVRKIPRGRVASYGQVAEASGVGRHRSRQIGYALHALKDDAVPWQRVVNRLGMITHGSDPAYQRERLEAEGVCFDERERVLPEMFVETDAIRPDSGEKHATRS